MYALCLQVSIIRLFFFRKRKEKPVLWKAGLFFLLSLSLSEKIRKYGKP
jgi:hypothetical protein